jgi:hypothetical protein
VKIPHRLFVLINQVLVLLLRSPLHGVCSNSILAIRYSGIKSGRVLTVPARYLPEDERLVVLTSRQTKWWPNFIHSTEADVLLAGRWVACEVQATVDRPDLVDPLMREMWARHPADAAYMDVKIQGGEFDTEDFAKARETAVLITITPL